MNKKVYGIIGIITGAVAINILGQWLCLFFNLPFFLNGIGTIITAYFLGPIAGSICAVLTNLLCSFGNIRALYYIFPNIIIAIFVGVRAKKNRFLSDVYLSCVTATQIIIINIFFSSILNHIFFSGETGNYFGDLTIEYIASKQWPDSIASLIGCFYIEFLNGVISVFAVFFLLKLFKKFKIKRCFCFILAAFLLTGTLFSSGRVTVSADDEITEKFTHTVFDNSDGLTSGQANDIAMGSDGLLWIATYAGLYCYNGNAFTLIDDFDTVKNANVVYIDSKDNLWIGTNDMGISVYRDGKIVATLDRGDGLPSNTIKAIEEDSEGNIYVGTPNETIILSYTDKISMVGQIDEAIYVDALSADTTGQIAAVSSSDETLYVIKDKKVICQRSLTTGGFNCCKFDNDGTLYAGTTDGRLFEYQIENQQIKQKSVDQARNVSEINDVFIDHETGYIYICTEEGVGYFGGKRTFHSIKTTDFNNSIDCMLEDYQGNFWFASSTMGLMRLEPSIFMDLFSWCGVDSKVVNTSAFWKDLLYVGTDDGLVILNTIDFYALDNDLTEKLDGVRIRCLFVDSQDHLWISTRGSGIYEVTEDKVYNYNSKNSQVGDKARLAIELSQGTIAVSSNKGIALISDHKVVKTYNLGDKLGDSQVLCVYQNVDGNVMAGTDGEGIYIIKDDEITDVLSQEDGLDSDVVMRIVGKMDGQGYYVVTGNGLCFMDNDYNITSLDNFPYYNVYDVLETVEGKLFVLSSAGIYVVDQQKLLSGESLSYVLLDYQEGLENSITSNAWNHMDENDNYYLSTNKGVYKFNLNDYIDQDAEYKVILADEDNNKYLSDSSEEAFNIQSDEDVFKLNIIVLNYSAVEPYVRYELEGFDKESSICKLDDLSTITYANVSGGTYNFKVEILNSDGDTVMATKNFTIVKEKKVYESLAFYAYFYLELLLILAWIIALLVRFTVLRVTRRQAEELKKAREKIEMGNQTILAIAKTVDAKDEYTSMHSQRVSEYSVLIAKELGWSEEECENIRKAGLLHDIGKIGIPDSVLNKPGKLTDEEFAIMKSHVVRGGEILKDFTLIEHVAEGAVYHHERYDGKGYMKGLKGEEIPIYARIIGMADAFDAMTGNRVYRKKMPFEKVLDEINKGRGTQFDPQMVDIILKLIEERKINVDELYREEN